MTRHRLIVQVDVEKHDDTWTEKDLTENFVYFVTAALDHEEQRDLLVEREGHSPFTVVDMGEVAVWTEAGYALDKAEEDEGHPVYPTAVCGCGSELIYTPEGWQHDAAPWVWGDDHDPDPDPEAIAEAAAWQAEYDKGFGG